MAASGVRSSLRILSTPGLTSVAVRCITSGTGLLNSAKVHQGFEGLQAGFVQDHKHGFGYTKDGKVVIVSPQDEVDINTPTGIASEETETILEVAKESYKERKTLQENSDHESEKS